MNKKLVILLGRPRSERDAGLSSGRDQRGRPSPTTPQTPPPTDPPTRTPHTPISLDRAEALTVGANPSLAAMERPDAQRTGRSSRRTLYPIPGFSSKRRTSDSISPVGGVGTDALVRTADRDGRQALAPGGGGAGLQKVARLERDGVGLELRAEVRTPVHRGPRPAGASARPPGEPRDRGAHLGAVRELVRAGEVSPIEELKVDADVSTARTDLAKGEAELSRLGGRLGALWGGGESDSVPLLDRCPSRTPAPAIGACSR